MDGGTEDGSGGSGSGGSGGGHGRGRDSRGVLGRGLHSFTFHLKLSDFCGEGGALRSCFGGDWDV